MEDRPHFWITEGNVTHESVERQGRTKPYPRDDYSAHGQSLFIRIQDFGNEIERKKDFRLSNDLILKIKTAYQTKIKNEQEKLKRLGFKIILRGDIPNNFTQHYSLIIELIDINDNIDVYSEILREFPHIYTRASVRAA